MFTHSHGEEKLKGLVGFPLTRVHDRGCGPITGDERSICKYQNKWKHFLSCISVFIQASAVLRLQNISARLITIDLASVLCVVCLDRS